MSAPYHTASCNKVNCTCLADHQEWEADCSEPEPVDFASYLLAIVVVYALIVFAFWGDVIASFIAGGVL